MIKKVNQHMKLKNQIIFFIIGISGIILSLLVKFLTKYPYTTWEDIKFYSYLLFVVELIFILIMFCPVIYRICYKKNKHFQIIVLIGTFLIAIGIGLIIFSDIPINAYVAEPIDNSIEEIRRYIEEYKIITFANDLRFNGFILIFISLAYSTIYLSIYTSIHNNGKSK